jgi:hypothetical protein
MHRAMERRRSFEASTTTVPQEGEPASLERWFRRASFLIVTAIVLLAGLGAFGVRSITSGAAGGGYEIEVTSAAVGRPGLAVPFSMTVSTSDGTSLPDIVTLKVDAPYLAILDENGIDPDPIEGFNDGKWVWWSFSVPVGSPSLTVAFDARIEPGVQWGTGGSAALEIDGRTMVTSEFATWVMP